MEYTIENDVLRATISSTGAEVLSLVRLSDEKEYWWQGDPQYWSGRSPILFPACGGLWNGEYYYEGKTYKMPKHGFVSNMEWEMVEQGGEYIVFQIKATKDTLEWFPFNFTLKIKYTVTDWSSLDCQYFVENNETDRTMLYQIGGHPAIALPDFKPGADCIGYLQICDNSHFAVNAKYLSVVRAGEQGCWSRQRHAVPTTEDGIIPINEATFANEALIFDKHQMTGVHILDLNKEEIVEVTSDSPVWLFWQQQNLLCPYICAEPWYGLCDLQGETTELIDRPYIQSATPDNVVTGTLWCVTIPE